MNRAYLLKTSLLLTSLVPLVVNCFALRPQYSLIVSSGIFLIHGFLFYYAIQDERFRFTDKFAEHILGETVKLEYFISTVLLNLGIGCLLTYLTYIQRRSIFDVVKLEKANTQLGRYFSPNVVEEISGAESDFLKPGGSLKNVAIMFSDIRNFTSISEKLSPNEVILLLSSYHSKMES